LRGLVVSNRVLDNFFRQTSGARGEGLQLLLEFGAHMQVHDASEYEGGGGVSIPGGFFAAYSSRTRTRRPMRRFGERQVPEPPKLVVVSETCPSHARLVLISTPARRR